MRSPHPQEIELKLALPADQLNAFRRRMARRRATPDEHDLVTRYFDTPDFALAAAGVALRVRRTGTGWVQTLKTEGERHGGLSRRIEFEMPVAGDALDWQRFPPEALAFVPERLRRAVVPVFETRFHRTTWLLAPRGGEIEVALDVGEVRAGERCEPLCEVELELKAGGPDLLFDLAFAWAEEFDLLPFDVSKAERGVRLAHGIAAAPVRATPAALDRKMRVEAGFVAIVQGCLAQLQANLPGVTTSDDIEYVHQARIALQRLRTALRLFREACPLPAALADGAKRLAAALGTVRDFDVLMRQTLPAIAPHDADADRWQAGLAALEASHAQARMNMRKALDDARPGAWLLAMQRWLLGQGERPDVPQQPVRLVPWAREALERGHQRLARDARAFATLDAAARHRLRIAVKRQRYAAEFFADLLDGRRALRYVASLRALQDALGRARDLGVARTLLADAPPDARPMRDFALGWLAATEDCAGDDEAVRCLEDVRAAKTYW